MTKRTVPFVTCPHFVTCPQPGVPHTNQFLVYATGTPDDINGRLPMYAETTGLALGRPWRPTPDPGRAQAEVTIGDGALDLDPAQIAATYGRLITGDARTSTPAGLVPPAGPPSRGEAGRTA